MDAVAAKLKYPRSGEMGPPIFASGPKQCFLYKPVSDVVSSHVIINNEIISMQTL